MIKVGMVGFDTSHTVAFVRCLNHRDVPQDHWVEGAEVVAGLATDPSPSRREDAKKYMEQVAAMGVTFVSSAEELLKLVDAILLECVDGHAHLAQIQPFLGKGKPIFVDKPFAGTGDQARRIEELAGRTKTPIFSASSMRYAPEVAAFRAADAEHGEIIQLLTYGPSLAMEGSAMSAMVFYGVHAVEVLYAMMGSGCREVASYSTRTTDVATGVWSDGRAGCVVGTRESKKQWGFTAFCKKTVEHRSLDISRVDTALLRRVVEFFRTGTPPVPVEETVETLLFLSAAGQSAQQAGRSVPVRL